MHLNTLVIHFDNEISHRETPLFRGAVIASLRNKHVLFHNHADDGFRYAYPLIQYKRVRRRATIVCLGEGVEEVGELFAADSLRLRLGDREEDFRVASLRPMRFNVQLWERQFDYRLTRWLPLNSDNYARYQQTDSLVERTQMLERILTGNMLSFLKGIGLHLDGRLSCTVTAVSEPHRVLVKGVSMTSLDVCFRSNLSLPDYIGLGKHASFGCGIVTRRKEERGEGREKSREGREITDE